MKKMKYAVVFVFILICMIFIGESYQDSFNSFTEGYASISIEKPENLSKNEMVSALIDIANEKSVEFFSTSYGNSSMANKDIFIYYSSEEVLEDLNKRFEIKERTYKSLLLGDTTIKFIPFAEIKDIGEIRELRLLGAEDDIKSFQKSIYKYAGEKPLTGKARSVNDNSLVLIWGITALAILMMTVYQLSLTKKETYIKISYGESPTKIILKNILYDTGIFSVLFCLSFLIVSKITYCSYLLKESIIIFAVFLIINSLLHLSIYRYDLKISLSGVNKSNSLLILNYGVKIVTMVLTVCIISSNIALVSEGYSYLKQRPFYKQYEDYNFLITMESGKTPKEKSSQKLSFEFYKECVKNKSVIAQSCMGGECDAIYINKNNEEYLKDEISSLKNTSFDINKMYFIVPETLENKETKLTNLKGFINLYFRTGEISDDMFEVITYDESVSMLAIENDSENLNSFHMNNPIIFFENFDEFGVDEIYGKSGEDFARYGIDKNLLFNNQKDDFIRFIADNGYDISNYFFIFANALEEFNEQAAKINNIVYINIILSLIVLFIEFILIALIIKLEYTVNSVELTLKKILGYNLFERNIRIFGVTLLTSSLSIAAALAVNAIFMLTQPINIILGWLIIVVLELPIIIYYVNKIEKSSAQKLLKGGLL